MQALPSSESPAAPWHSRVDAERQPGNARQIRGQLAAHLLEHGEALADELRHAGAPRVAGRIQGCHHACGLIKHGNGERDHAVGELILDPRISRPPALLDQLPQFGRVRDGAIRERLELHHVEIAPQLLGTQPREQDATVETDDPYAAVFKGSTATLLPILPPFYPGIGANAINSSGAVVGTLYEGDQYAGGLWSAACTTGASACTVTALRGVGQRSYQSQFFSNAFGINNAAAALPPAITARNGSADPFSSVPGPGFTALGIFMATSTTATTRSTATKGRCRIAESERIRRGGSIGLISTETSSVMDAATLSKASAD
jgi:hypothetical protein